MPHGPGHGPRSAGVHALVAVGPDVKSAKVKALGAAIFHVSSQGILASKEATAIVALVVALPHVNALVVSLEVCLAHKLLVAVVDIAREGVFAFVVMGLHVRLEVVAPAEELAAPLDLALEVGFLLGR